jgi:hypothetical protein
MEAGADLFEVRQFVGEGERLTRADDLGQRDAVDVFHRHERLMVVLTGIVDGDDVLVAQVAGGACLAQEALDQLVLEEEIAEDFDGEEAVEIRVARKVDGAHPAVAETADDLVLADAIRNLGHGSLAVCPL